MSQIRGGSAGDGFVLGSAVQHDGRKVAQLNLAMSTQAAVEAGSESRNEGLVGCLLLLVLGVLGTAWAGRGGEAGMRERATEISQVARAHRRRGRGGSSTKRWR